MSTELEEFSRSVPFGIFLTVGLFVFATRVQKRVGGSPWLHPVLIGAGSITLGLHLFGIPLEHYRKGADFIHILLGPATVALAVPLFRQVSRIRESLFPVLASVLAGSIAASGSAVGIAHLLGASRTTLLSLAPKSVSTPIAMGLSESIGGDPGRTVLFVAFTGILGAVAGAGFFRLLRIRDERAIGIGFGVASHGVGTSRALQLGETQGAFSSLAMGLTGLGTAVLLPVFVRLFG